MSGVMASRTRPSAVRAPQMLLVVRYRQETTRDERIGLIIHPPADECRLLPVILAVRDFLALFEHVFFGLVVGNICRR